MRANGFSLIERVTNMTNRIWESRNDYHTPSHYVACSNGCGRVTAWTLCVMCGGNYATHNTLGVR